MKTERSHDYPVMIPIDIIRRKDLSPLARLLYGEFDRAIVMQQGNFSLDELAELYDVSVNVVQEALDELINAELFQYKLTQESNNE